MDVAPLVQTLTAYRASGGTDINLLHRAAEQVLDLRATYTLHGKPDWAGRRGAYKAAISQVYREVGCDEAAARTIQATLSYHVGNLLRLRLSDAELADAGLSNVAPRTRHREHSRLFRNQPLYMLRMAGRALTATVQADTLTPSQAATALSVLADMQTRLDEIAVILHRRLWNS